MEPAAGGIANQPPLSPSLGEQRLRVPCSVALLSPCLIQSQSREQKKKPLVKAVFGGACT